MLRRLLSWLGVRRRPASALENIQDGADYIRRTYGPGADRGHEDWYGHGWRIR